MWDPYEDLEIDHEEAARTYPLSSDDLKRIAARSPPIPQSWYDEDFSGLFEHDPFDGEWGGE